MFVFTPDSVCQKLLLSSYADCCNENKDLYYFSQSESSSSAKECGKESIRGNDQFSYPVQEFMLKNDTLKTARPV